MTDFRTFDSPVFGLTRHADPDEVIAIQRLVTECPIDVFAALNKRLNKTGLCLVIDSITAPPREVRG